MKEGTPSAIEGGVKRKLIAEFSEPSSTISPPQAKRQKTENTCPSSKFKGVVRQANGHWGAQIYANHRRFWLGTFKSEAEAAMAYDSASIKLRTQDYHRNLPWTNKTVHEPSFQTAYNTKTILNMIRDGSYPSKFAYFLDGQRGEQEVGSDLMKVQGHVGVSTTLLFQKELTPSDVGKLNRLVIPKQYAVLHFPPVENKEESTNSGKLDDLQLFFYDTEMKLWEFRYCYWKSSQSFVFTRGWNRFVKEKGLVANDTVLFYSCTCKLQDKEREQQPFLLIDVMGTAATRNPRMVEAAEKNACLQVDVCLRLGGSFSCGKAEKEKEVCRGPEAIEGLMMTSNVKKSIRLFGVEIK